MQKHVNLVDLVKSFPTNILLQNLASIQPRTRPIKFVHLAEKSEKGSISNLSTKVSSAVLAIKAVRDGIRTGAFDEKKRKSKLSTLFNALVSAEVWGTMTPENARPMIDDVRASLSMFTEKQQHYFKNYWRFAEILNSQ